MKIKLLKNFLDCKVGDKDEDVTRLAMECYLNKLIDDGFAEIVKDDIDMEEIRKSFLIEPHHLYDNEYINLPYPNKDEAEWFTAYRIVKAVTDKLNGDWKPDWEDENTEKYAILYDYDVKSFEISGWCLSKYSIIPNYKDEETAKKVISLCEPELKVLFGIN